MKLSAFKKQYAFNKHRRFLYNLFIEDLHLIKSQCKYLRVLVFGSYITHKQKPHDIDLMLGLIPCQDCVYNIMKNGLQQEHPKEIDIQYKKTQYFLKDAKGLVTFFNSNPLNKKKGIYIKKAVEIVEI